MKIHDLLGLPEPSKELTEHFLKKEQKKRKKQPKGWAKSKYRGWAIGRMAKEKEKQSDKGEN